MGGDYLDLTVPTDNRPFFFNQLRFTDIPEVARRALDHKLGGGVRRGNLTASAVLILILFISIGAVIATILVPLRGGARKCPRHLVIVGSLAWGLHVTLTISALCYFLLIPTSFALLGPVLAKKA